MSEEHIPRAFGARGRPTKAKPQPINYADYPLIGYEYEYLNQPVRIKRVCPSPRDPDSSHVEFETRYCDRSSCESGELGEWQKIDAELSSRQMSQAMLDLLDAIEDATTDEERALAQWQSDRLKKIREAAE